jgi:hypothetical protein
MRLPGLPPLQQGALRRAILFLIAIGAPLIAGVALQQPAGALLGAISGMTFAFADDDGALWRRLKVLGFVAGGIALGAAAGLLLRGFPWPVWLLFAGATFASGYLLGVGKAQALAARYGAMALVITSGAPAFQPAEIQFTLGTLAIVLLSRLIDHWLAGPLPQQTARPRRIPSGGWIRFAIAYAGAATASLTIGVALDPGRVLWVVVTTLVVMQPDARSSYVLIVQRVAGTVLGVVAAFAITSAFGSPWAIAAVVLVIAVFIPHHLHHRYWLHTALIALMILLAYDLAASDPRMLHSLFTERLQDLLLGSGLALIGTLAAFPRHPPEES